MALTPFLGQDLTAYRIDNTVYSITYRHGIRQRNPIHKNPLSKGLLSQLLTGDPEQVQRLAPAFSQSMGISLHRGYSHLRPWCAHGIFRSRKSRQTVGFPSSRPYFKEDSRHLRVAAFLDFVVCRESFVVHRFGGQMPASGFERIGPQGGRDGFAFGEPLRRRCPWTDNNVILRRVQVFAGCGQSMKYVVIGLSDPDAVDQLYKVKPILK